VGAVVRAVDGNYSSGVFTAGLLNGKIVKVDFNKNQTKIIQDTHYDGEVWGLSTTTSSTCITSCDDNQIKVWDIKQRKLIGNGTICTEQRKVSRGGASSLTKMADSQCSRAVCFNASNGHVAVGHNDGTLTIRKGVDALDTIIATNNNSKEWIEAISYSPDGARLAVGSHDNNVYIYDVGNKYALLGSLKGNSSFIVSVDWSADG